MTTPITQGTGKTAEDCGIVPDLASLSLSTEAEDGEGTLGGPTPFETIGLSTEAELGLESASAPCLFVDDFLVDEDIFMSPECVALPEDHPRPSMEPPVNPAAYVPDPEPIFGSNDSKNQTELVSTQTEEHEPELAILELLRLMAEDPVQFQLESEPLDRLQKNNQGPGTEELHSSHNFPSSSFEAMENAFMWPGILNSGQDIDPHFQEQFGSQAPPEPPPFLDLPGPSLPLNLPSTSNYVSTEPCGNAYQLPRLQHVHPSYLPVVPCLADNRMQSNHQLTPDFFQPSRQLPNGIWLIPYSSYMKTNQSSFTFGSQVPQMYNSTSSVSAAHRNLNSLLTSYGEVPLLPSQDFQCSISHEHEQPLVVQSCCEGNNHSQELYKNYRRWQMFCKVASSFYTSSPDVEALACFFTQVINSITLQCPGIPRSEAVKIVVSQWEKLSDFERMEYYHQAQRFMDYELKEMVSLWTIEATSCQNTEQQQQTPTVRDEPPAMCHGLQATDQKQSSYTAPPDLAEVAPDEYSEAMEAPETNNKEESDDNQDKKVMQDDDKEQDGLFSQIFSQDDPQDVPTGATLAPAVCNLHPQSPDESISAAAPKLKQPLESPEPKPQTLQSGYYMDDGILPPRTTSSEKAAFLNQSSDPEVPLPDRDIPVCASSPGLQLLSFQNLNPQVTFKMFPPLPEPSSHFQMSSVNHNSMGHPGSCLPENCSVPTLTQKDIHKLSDQNEPSSSHASPTIIGSGSEDIKQDSSPKTMPQKGEKITQSTAMDSNSFQNDLESPENADNIIISGASVETSPKDAIKEDSANKCMTGKQSQNESMADLQNDSDETDVESFNVTDNNDGLPKMVINPVEQACPVAQLSIKDNLNLNEPIDHQTEYHHPEVTRLLTPPSSSSLNCPTSSSRSIISRLESRPNQEPKEINNKAVPSFVMDTRRSNSDSLQSVETAGKDDDVKMKTNAPKQAGNPMLANEGHRKHHMEEAKEMTTSKAARRGNLNSGTLVDERRWTRSLDKKDKDVQTHNDNKRTNNLIYNTKTSLVDMPRVISDGADEEKVTEIQVIDQSKRIDQFEQSLVQDQLSNGRTDQRRITRRCCMASQQLQLGNRGKGRQNLDESIRINKTSLTEVQEKDAKRSRTRQHGQDMVMTRKGTRTKQEETARKRSATPTTDLQSHEQKDLGQDQQCIGLQSHGLSRSLTRSKKPLKSSLLALVLPQTRQKEEERKNDGREEMEGSLTRAKRANSDKSLESLPTKKQKMTSNKKPGFQVDVANLKASSTPSSSERSRWETRGSPATSREIRAEEREQMVKSCGGKRVKAQASQKGLRQRWSNRLATLQKRAKLTT